MNLLRKLFGKSEEESARDCQAAGDACEDAIVEIDAQLEEIDECIRTAEKQIVSLEGREDQLREDGEALIMESHDPMQAEGAVPREAQEILAREVKKMLDNCASKREEYELKVLHLQLRRAQLSGEHRHAEELLRDLGRVDPLSSVHITGIPQYPNIVEKGPAERNSEFKPLVDDNKSTKQQSEEDQKEEAGL